MPDAIACADCGATLTPSADLPADRQPCPKCGSTSRVFDVQVRCSFSLVGRVKGHSRHNPGRKGKHKWGREEWFGDEFSRKARQWAKIERTADRDKDWYQETFTNPESGEVLHHCEERLSEHHNRNRTKKS